MKEKKDEKIYRLIYKIFNKREKVHYFEIYKIIQTYISDLDHIELLFYLKNIINNNIKINKKYLREDNNKYYLIGNMDYKKKINLLYYVNNKDKIKKIYN